MGVIQVNFSVPHEIEIGLRNNTLIRCGGVVRNQDGSIATHLKEVDCHNDDDCAVAVNNKSAISISDDSIITKISSFIKNNKGPVIAAGLIVVAVAGISYVIIKNKSTNDKKVPTYVDDFNNSLKKYFNEIKNTNLTVETINALINSIDNLKKNEEIGDVTTAILIENSEILIDMVKNFTEQFTKVNSYAFDKKVDLSNDFDLIKHYLIIQKDVFRQCS